MIITTRKREKEKLIDLNRAIEIVEKNNNQALILELMRSARLYEKTYVVTYYTAGQLIDNSEFPGDIKSIIKQQLLESVKKEI